MNAMRRLLRRLKASVPGQRDDERLREELAEHLTLLTDEYVRSGLSPDEARRRARLRLGAADAITEAYRDEQRLGWLDDLGADLRSGIRNLWRNPGFGSMAILTLALGTGVNLAVFSVINAVLIRPLPFRHPGELMLIQLLTPGRDVPGPLWSYPKYEIVRDRQQVFTATALFAERDWSLTKTDDPERLRGEVVEAPYFGLLGVETSMGRVFTADDDRVGATPVAIVSHALWQRRFGSRGDVLGTIISLDGDAITIIGVMPSGFRGLFGQADVWRPMKAIAGSDLTEPFSHSYYQLARRRPGVSLDQANAGLSGIGEQIDAAYPVADAVRGSGATAVPVSEVRVNPFMRRIALVLFGAVGVVLLIACVNLANLTLVRGLARQREVAIRRALGASRLRIIRQFFTESLCLSVAGTAVGAIVATTSIRIVSSTMPDVAPLLRGQAGGLMRVGASMLGVDANVVFVAVGLAVVTALICGLMPAVQAARGDLTSVLKTAMGASHSTGLRGLAFRNALLVGEVALALVMLVSAGLMLKSLMRLGQTELGFRPERVLTFRLDLPDEAYPSERSLPFVDQFLKRLQARSEVEAAAFGHCAPIAGRCNGTFAYFPDRPPVTSGAKPEVGVTWVSPDFFHTLGIRLVRGRWFTDRDRQGQPKVVVINEAAAKQFWPNDDPIGQRMGVGQGGFRDGAEVIGIAADVRYRAVETPPGPDVYLPVLQSPRSGGVIFVRSHLPASAVVPIIRQELASLDRDLPLSEIKTMDERYGDATWQTWTIGVLLSIFAGLALVLALVGVFAVLAQSVAQRTREIGVRMALGAAPLDIQRLILGRAVTIAAAGVMLGLGAAWFASRLLTTLLYEVEPNDPTVLSGIALILFVVTLVASYLPARRAARIDPLQTIRAE
jgi:putative ABC transport system permease protein